MSVSFAAVMDDFTMDHPELGGSLIQMEFGKGGRIRQLWVTDPSRPQVGDNYPFVLPALSFAEELSEDYLPGTILIGARTNPEEPWIVSRNSGAENLDAPEDDDDEDDEDDDGPGAGAQTTATFRYEFSLLPELDVTGHFHEEMEPLPHVLWDIRIHNRGRGAIEIGELAFPFAFDNFYEVGGRPGREELWSERYAIHKFIGGAASYLHVQRLDNEPPGLIVIPGEKTSWEFYTHVPSSLTTGFRWEGIPVVYIHSRASVEREHWPQWVHGHSSVTLEQDETVQYQLKFLPTDRDRKGGMQSTLMNFGHPTARLWPAAVAPVGAEISVEVGGTTPTQFRVDRDATLEPDSFDGGGGCTIKTETPGQVNLSWDDTQGRTAHCHLLFTDPIDELIRRRARWIVENQVCEESTNLLGAIVNTDLQVGLQMTDVDEYQRPFGLVCSVADALYLAEKNLIEPNAEEIEVLDAYLEEFLFDDLQNPKSLEVGSSLVDERSVAVNPDDFLARLTQWLLSTVSKIAQFGGSTTRPAKWYSDRSASMGPLIQRIAGWDGMDWSPEQFWTLFENGPLPTDRLMGMVAATKAPTPSWWWYGSDKRFLKDDDGPHPAMLDKGEMCLGPSTPLNALLAIEVANQRPAMIPDWLLRASFGGMAGVWALVRPDGAAAMGYCPDTASRQFGMSWYTGDIGLTLWTYLRSVAVHVYPNGADSMAFGCTLDQRQEDEEDWFTIRPWDGVGRRIVVHDWNVEATVEGASIEAFEFESRKRRARVTLHNRGELPREASLVVTGLWGTKLKPVGQDLEIEVGEPIVKSMLAGEKVTLILEVLE